ncbi:MerR family transcriptional regulator [Microbacterium sp. CFH 31415]|uniref:helix-turn-helix domain-containing protein n=1 Tax=Microbacterium sp. CFH 31415 TaxID=2921732 RepID=UPI001F13380F|nr:MerR family transcriptional regulator [Microbacterium sp. CFH 31415]MCH6230329.1 MerR family transcriptional regulator [Microbacterium sp. CFH 31415]
MAWSTRELANLAGTTVNTIRHYHRLGLLEVPEREDNGYKQYEVRHLVRLLRIRRLTDLGVPLSQIGSVTAGEDSTPDALREIDADLATTIERLQQARADIAVILRDGAPADTPAGFEAVASRLSEADSSIIHIYKKLYDDDALADLRAMVDGDDDVLGAEIAALPADADEASRAMLAERLAPIIAQLMTDYPWISDPGAHLSRSPLVTQETFIEAMVELYNPAQRDVIARASILAHAQLRDGADEGEDDT